MSKDAARRERQETCNEEIERHKARIVDIGATLAKLSGKAVEYERMLRDEIVWHQERTKVWAKLRDE